MEELDLKDQLFNVLETAEMTGGDTALLAEEIRKPESLLAKCLSYILGQADARAMLMAGQDLDTEAGLVEARRQQFRARGLSEAVELIIDLTVEAEENKGDK